MAVDAWDMISETPNGGDAGQQLTAEQLADITAPKLAELWLRRDTEVVTMLNGLAEEQLVVEAQQVELLLMVDTLLRMLNISSIQFADAMLKNQQQQSQNTLLNFSDYLNTKRKGNG